MKRILLSAILLFTFIGYSQSTVNYSMRIANFNSIQNEKNNAPPYTGTLDNAATEIIQYANNGSFGNTPGTAAFQTFTITGNGTSGAARTLKVGDRFTISLYTSGYPSSGGRIGISFRNTTTVSNFFSSTDSNTLANFQLDDSGGWKIYHSSGSTANAGATPGTDRTLSIEVTSSTTFNATINGTTYYDLTFKTTGPIAQFCIYSFGDNNSDAYWKPATLSNFGYSASDGLRFGYDLSSGSRTVSGIISDGSNTNSTSGSLTNKVLVGGNTGYLIFSGTNTYTGATTLNTTSRLELQNAQAMGNTSGVTVSNTSTLALYSTSGITFNNYATTINGVGQSGNIGAIRSIGGNNVWPGNITLGSISRINADITGAAGSLTLSGVINLGSNELTVGGSGANVTISNSVNGSGKLVKDGSNILNLSASNTYTGNTEINQGEVWIQDGGSVASGSAVYLGNTFLSYLTTKLFLAKSNGGTNFSRNINVNYGDATFRRVIGGLNTSGENIFSGNIVRASNVPLTVEVVNAGGTVTISGVIGGGGSATLTKEGAGTLNLTNTNTYTAGTTVSAGTLLVTKSGYVATITTSGISVVFSSPPTGGTYAILPGALSSTSTLLSTLGLASGQTASFNGGTGVLTVFDLPSVSLVSNDADNTFCAGTNVTFTATASNVGGGTVAYNFKVNGSSVQNSASNMYSTTSLANGQAVTVEITITGGTFLSSTTATSNSISNTVQALPASAGNNGTISICSTTTLTTALLYGALTGSPAVGGTWSPTPTGAGTYTYTQFATSPCTVDNTAQVVVTIQPAPASAGSNGTLSICSTTTLTTALLYGALTGSPTIGGIWSPAPADSGTYTYTQAATSPCTVDNTAQVVVTVTTALTWYLDADNDLYYTGAGILQCDSPGLGYTTTVTGGGDCADGNAAINPGITEVCYNNIDDNCNLTLSEGCAAVPVNMTASYNGTTLPSLATAIPAVAYTYLSVTNLKYRFSITNVTTGVTSSDIIQSSRYVTIPAALHSSPGVYTIKASAVINDEVVAYSGNTVTVNAPNIPKITLAPGSCGATLAALTSTLTANAGLNATGYTFRIRLTSDNGPTPTYGTSSSSTRFVSANSFTGFPLSYGTSYQVAVQYSYTDPVTTLSAQSGYGAECTVVTPSIPTTSLASPTCGSQVATLNANISAAAASYAVNYQFRIRKTSDVGGPYTESAPNASRFSSLTAFGLTLAYNTQYSISVRYSVVVNGSPVWSNYGSECIVKTPFFPTTSLVQSQCGLEAATTLTQQLNIIPYQGFPNYKVRLQEVIGEDLGEPQDIVVTYPYFRLSQFSTAELGKNYNVSVAIKLGNVFGDFSTECDIHTPEAARTIKMPFTATAYPNPFANNFMIDVKTTSQSSVNLKVYDMVGRLIEQRDVRVSDMETATIGERYPSGIYNVVVSQEDSVETVRVVKR